VGWAYSVRVIDCCTREIVGWNLSHRCRTKDALVAVEQAVLERLPEGSREENVMLTTDNGTQFTSSHFLETLGRLGITHRRTAYHHPEGKQLHRTVPSQLGRGGSLDGGVSERLEEARASIACWIEEYNHDRPHRGVQNRTPHEAFLAFATDLISETLAGSTTSVSILLFPYSQSNGKKKSCGSDSTSVIRPPAIGGLFIGYFETGRNT
jgi:transposase InsO family protein